MTTKEKIKLLLEIEKINTQLEKTYEKLENFPFEFVPILCLEFCGEQYLIKLFISRANDKEPITVILFNSVLDELENSTLETYLTKEIESLKADISLIRL